MYAQNNEDDFFHLYLDLNKKGKYVDIGAGDPKELSNTYMLYLKGWEGLCVEPHSHYHAKWMIERPVDVLERVAIVDKPATYRMANTIIEGSWLYDEKCNEGYKFFTVEGITMKQLLARNPTFYDADLLSIDVELAEDKVLAETDFKKFTPKLIIIEKHIRGKDQKYRWEHFLTPFYEPVREFSGNTFYLRKV